MEIKRFHSGFVVAIDSAVILFSNLKQYDQRKFEFEFPINSIFVNGDVVHIIEHNNYYKWNILTGQRSKRTFRQLVSASLVSDTLIVGDASEGELELWDLKKRCQVPLEQSYQLPFDVAYTVQRTLGRCPLLAMHHKELFDAERFDDVELHGDVLTYPTDDARSELVVKKLFSSDSIPVRPDGLYPIYENGRIVHFETNAALEFVPLLQSYLKVRILLVKCAYGLLVVVYKTLHLFVRIWNLQTNQEVLDYKNPSPVEYALEAMQVIVINSSKIAFLMKPRENEDFTHFVLIRLNPFVVIQSCLDYETSMNDLRQWLLQD